MGTLIANPGQRSDGGLLAGFMPGRTSALIFTFRAADDKPPPLQPRYGHELPAGVRWWREMASRV